jgi:hypothetical protein
MPTDWLTLALGVLPPAPADLTVARAEGGEVDVRLCGHCDAGLLVRMAVADADATSGVIFAIKRPGGAAFAVFGSISTRSPLGGEECEVLIEVDEVLRWKQRRRTDLDLPATVALCDPPTTQHNELTPVRVLNLSAEGVAFSTRGRYRNGDRILLSLQMAELPFVTAARVLQVGRPVFGQSRVSCTFPYHAGIAEEIRRRPGDGEAASA